MTPENQIKLMKVIDQFSEQISDLIKIADKTTKILEQLEVRVKELEK